VVSSFFFLSSFFLGTHNSQRQGPRIIGMSWTASTEEAWHPSIQENANISSECLVTDKAIQLQPDFVSLLVCKLLCNPSTRLPAHPLFITGSIVQSAGI